MKTRRELKETIILYSGYYERNQKEISDLKKEIFELNNPPKYNIGDIIAHIKIEKIEVKSDIWHVGNGYVRMYTGYNLAKDERVEIDEVGLKNKFDSIEYKIVNKIN